VSWTVLDALGSRLLDATVAVALLLAGSAIAVAACRQPARRLMIARLALVAAVLTLPWMLLVQPRGALPALETLARQAAGPGTGQARPPFDWLARGSLAIHAAGMILALASCALTVWAVRRLKTLSREPGEATIRSFREAVDGRMTPALRVSDRIKRPLLVGVARPVVVIPGALEAGDRKSLELALLHEAIHARRGDSRWSFLGALIQRFWFYLPPAAWLREQMRIDQEYLVDDAAARWLSSRGEYAGRLLDASRPGSPPETKPGTLRRPSRFQPLAARLAMLVRRPAALEHRPPAWCLCAALACFAALLCAASEITVLDKARARGGQVAAVPAARPVELRLASVVIEPREPAETGKPSAPLLGNLPPRFEMTFSMPREALRQGHARLFGTVLRTPREAGDRGPSQELVPVKIERDGPRLGIMVDSVPHPCDAPPGALLDSLWIEAAAGQSVSLRDVVLRWPPARRASDRDAARDGPPAGRFDTIHKSP
jgi:beta-lactamase regulating signal transducer with metallopeptidase domain